MFWYDNAKLILGKADLDFDTVTLNARLLMTNTTADTEKDKVLVSGFTTLDNYDGSGVSSPVDLASVAIAVDGANNRAEIDCADFSFGATVGAGTRNAQGMLICKKVGGDGTDIPVAWIDTGGFPFNGNGGAINVTVNAEGLLQIT